MGARSGVELARLAALLIVGVGHLWLSRYREQPLRAARSRTRVYVDTTGIWVRRRRPGAAATVGLGGGGAAVAALVRRQKAGVPVPALGRGRGARLRGRTRPGRWRAAGCDVDHVPAAGRRPHAGRYRVLAGAGRPGRHSDLSPTPPTRPPKTRTSPALCRRHHPPERSGPHEPMCLGAHSRCSGVGYPETRSVRIAWTYAWVPPDVLSRRRWIVLAALWLFRSAVYQGAGCPETGRAFEAGLPAARSMRTAVA